MQSKKTFSQKNALLETLLRNIGLVKYEHQS
jgi:hypothetical protein